MVTRINKLQLPGIALGSGVVAPFAETVKSLGVVLDRTLSWKPHVDHLSSKVHRALYSLRFFRSSTTELLRHRLVKALIFPLLDYCSIVTVDATYEQQSRIQRLQNACLRYIFGVKRSDHVTPFRQRLGWLRTETRRQYFTAVLMYKILHYRTPLYLHEMFEKRQLSRPFRGATRDLTIPQVYTRRGKLSFRVQGVQLWNSLPGSIKYLPSLSRFKTALHEHLLALD